MWARLLAWSPGATGSLPKRSSPHTGTEKTTFAGVSNYQNRGIRPRLLGDDRDFLPQAMEGDKRRTVLCLDWENGDRLWQAGVDAMERVVQETQKNEK